MRINRITLTMAFIILGASTPALAVPPGLNLLSDLPNGIFDSRGYAVSNDGNMVAGFGSTAAGPEAMRWTEAGGMVGLGLLAGLPYSTAYGISGDGNTVVGFGHQNILQTNGVAGDQAFRWTQATGMVGLGYLNVGDNYSLAAATNSDGSVVVGNSSNTVAGTAEAFRWAQATGMVGLGQLAGNPFPFSYAQAVSNDGNTIVGVGLNAGSALEAFVWKPSTGMVGIGDLAGGAFNSSPYGISGDGSIVVGTGTSAGGKEAFRWTQATGMVGLGFLAGGSTSDAFAISKNGNVIVGASNSQAYRWTQASGMVTVADWLALNGRPVTNGYVMTIANATNADGSVIVGEGTNSSGQTEAFLAKLGPFGGGLIGLNTFGQSLASSADILPMTTNIGSQILGTIHAGNLLDIQAEAARGSCMWVAGDWGRFNRYDASVSTQEIGVCHDFESKEGNEIRAGVGIGKAYLRQDLRLNGHANMDGEYLIAETDFRNPTHHFLATATMLYGDWNGDVSRGYINAGAQVFSKANVNSNTFALRLKAELIDWLNVGKINFTPKLAYSLLKGEMDDYTETGGGFPARFNARRQQAHEVRAGLQANASLGLSTKISAGLDLVRRLDKNVSDIQGTVLDGFDFRFSAPSVSQNWVQANLQIQQKISSNVVATGNLGFATRGEAPSYGAGATLQVFF